MESVSGDSIAHLRVLAEVSKAFALVGADYQTLIEKIARAMADFVGDGCSVTLLDVDGDSLINVANAHRVHALETDYRAYMAGRRVSKATSSAVSAQVIRSGEPRLVPDILPGKMVAQADEALKPIVARLNVHSFVVVPIRTPQAVIGVLSLLRSASGRGYSLDDLTLLQDLADRAGLALDNARHYRELERRRPQPPAEVEGDTVNDPLAHDLRATLSALDDLSRTLLAEYDGNLDDRGRHHLRQLRSEIQRMSALVDEVVRVRGVNRAKPAKES